MVAAEAEEGAAAVVEEVAALVDLRVASFNETLSTYRTPFQSCWVQERPVQGGGKVPQKRRGMNALRLIG